MYPFRNVHTLRRCGILFLAGGAVAVLAAWALSYLLECEGRKHCNLAPPVRGWTLDVEIDQCTHLYVLGQSGTLRVCRMVFGDLTEERKTRRVGWTGCGVITGTIAGASYEQAAVPFWVLFAGCAAYPVVFALRTLGVRRRRLHTGHCPTCGYDLTGNVSGRCPECGKLTDRSTSGREPADAL